MTSIIKLEALSGVQDDGPLCYLLQVDEVFFLLDCGWDERFDMAYIEAVKRRIPRINAVLLSYADILHLGALPYLVRKCGLNCPVYATVPVYKMGQMFLYDWVNGHTSVEDFTLFNLDDIDGAFERVQQVKYSQTILLKGANGLQITPLPAGHMIGGAIWRITKMGDEEIVYAVDFNHKKERHLNGCSFEGIGRPNLMITDAFNAVYNQPRRKQRDEQLVTKLLGTVRDGGDVMIVIDTAGRVLEIAHLLDQLWHNAEAGLMTYNLAMLSHVASSVVEFAKSQVEWMSDKILKSFEGGRYNPFQFRHVQLCHSSFDLMRVRSPKVVLVSGLDMECGFSREIFLEWCSDIRNTVIVTGRSGDRTLGSKLIRMAEQMAEKPSAMNRILTLEVKRRIRLEGNELENYRSKKREEEREAARKRLEASRRNARLEQADSSSDDSDNDDTMLAVTANALMNAAGGNTAKSVNITARHASLPNTNDTSTPFNGCGHHLTASQLAEQRSHDIMWKWEQQQKSSFFKQSKKAFPVFPYVEEKTRWDDYGEIIRPEEYMIADNTATVPHLPAERTADTNTPESPASENGQTVPHYEEREWPTKCISQITKIEVLCKVEFIDFEGRSDGDSVKKILSQIKPKQLIIVHGSSSATRHLAQYASENGIVQGKIFTPRLGEIVDATIESHIYQVTLSDALMSSLIFQSVKDAELSWLDARIARRKVTNVLDENDPKQLDGQSEMMQDDNNDHQDESAQTDDSVEYAERLSNKKAASADTFCLEPMLSTKLPSHQAVFVNDPKLSDMKQLLMSNGYHAEFSSGVLYINNVASIRRNEAGRFHIEGCACEDYYKIRDIVYAQFAIV
ncbi:unnamed protein product [Anisakis simplex]|uniref:Cleavage and polyadenylation specificity factor subunit 2 n=1 Tax=Anisakis simplex TaxID=6269 RepID=A0A0M3K472_ANISI|nr:unnamed protein product [Anisakis simplex]